jgi:hypothetical protein
MADPKHKRTGLEIKQQVLEAWALTMETIGSDGKGTGGMHGYMTTLDSTDRQAFLSLGRGLLPVTPPAVTTNVAITESGTPTLRLMEEFAKVSKNIDIAERLRARREAARADLQLPVPQHQTQTPGPPPAARAESDQGPSHPTNHTFTVAQSDAAGIHQIAARQRADELATQAAAASKRHVNGAPPTVDLKPRYRQHGVTHFEADND